MEVAVGEYGVDKVNQLILAVKNGRCVPTLPSPEVVVNDQEKAALMRSEKEAMMNGNHQMNTNQPDYWNQELEEKKKLMGNGFTNGHLPGQPEAIKSAAFPVIVTKPEVCNISYLKKNFTFSST